VRLADRRAVRQRQRQRGSGDGIRGRAARRARGGTPREQRPVEVRRDGALFACQVRVARAHGETVGLAHGRDAGDLDRQVEVAHHAPDQRELLCVLLTEEGDVGPDDVEELHDHGAAEMPGPGPAAEPVLEVPDFHIRFIPGREHRLRLRAKDDIDPFPFQESGIPVEIPGIGPEILLRAELDRVDEDADDGDVRPHPALPDEAQMPLVKKPHGRDQSDLRPAGAGLGRGRLHLRNRAKDLHDRDPFFARPPPEALRSPATTVRTDWGLRW